MRLVSGPQGPEEKDLHPTPRSRNRGPLARFALPDSPHRRRQSDRRRRYRRLDVLVLRKRRGENLFQLRLHHIARCGARQTDLNRWGQDLDLGTNFDKQRLELATFLSNPRYGIN